jgi:predicted RNase H-like nuclease (RuvC/YqgF family)
LTFEDRVKEMNKKSENQSTEYMALMKEKSELERKIEIMERQLKQEIFKGRQVAVVLKDNKELQGKYEELIEKYNELEQEKVYKEENKKSK